MPASMLALSIRINDGKPIVCGADDLRVLNAYVSLVGVLGPKTTHPRPDEAPDLYVSAGGLTSRGVAADDEHMKWIQLQDLRVGDKVTIEVVRTENPDAPVSRKPARGAKP